MSTPAPQLLVADDDKEIRKLLGRYLQEQGFRVLLASSCGEVHEKIANHQVDLIILDVMLPDGSGLDLCRDLRAARSNIPVILLTALQEDVDRIIGLEIGADDYLGKPFNPRELAARVRAVLRRGVNSRPDPSKAGLLQFEDFIVDSAVRSVTDRAGAAIQLTGAEFDLLMIFLDRPGRLLSREMLLDLTRRRDGDVLDRSIDVLVSRLRRKLSHGHEGQIFKAIRNGGYQFAAKVSPLDP
ncbi:response regulator [Aquabacter cavernae]|uniref:response regulator n=1 Tax=Aquabacter cavernae TaxID=2496029 RepID=UPI000F8E7BD3|nr:response regulator [Aquabacter cavernae]